MSAQGDRRVWIVRLSDHCRARAGQASTFEHELWVIHDKHTSYSHLVSCRGACGDVGVCTQAKTRGNMTETGKGGWCECCSARWRPGRLVELGGLGFYGWEERVCSRGALDGTGAGTVGTRLRE
jgi:hypothetical protein